MKITFTRGSQADVIRADSYYHKIDPALAESFRQILRDLCKTIGTNPKLFPVYADPVRRALMNHFPYSVYYENIGDRIVILGVEHQKCRPRPRRRYPRDNRRD